MVEICQRPPDQSAGVMLGSPGSTATYICYHTSFIVKVLTFSSSYTLLCFVKQLKDVRDSISHMFLCWILSSIVFKLIC